MMDCQSEKGRVMPSNSEKIVYTTCMCNCGGNSACVIKAHVQDGKVIRVEPDDRYNRGVGMEDKALTLEDLVKNRLQRRPCTMGLVFHKYLHMEQERVIYPLKRISGARRGEGRFRANLLGRGP